MAKNPSVGAQLKKLAESDEALTAADLTKLSDVDATATELDKLDGSGAVVASGTQQSHITDVTVTGTYADDDDAIEAAINSIIAALEAFGITATS